MASQLPTRRATRATRLVVAEDSHPKPVARAATSRLKAGAASGGLTTTHHPNINKHAAGSSSLKDASAADPTAATKRKREALGEVAGKNTAKPKPAAKSEKENVFSKDKETQVSVEIAVPPPPKARSAAPPIRSGVAERRIAGASAIHRKTRSASSTVAAVPIVEVDHMTTHRAKVEVEEDAVMVDAPRARRVSARIAAPSHAAPPEATRRVVAAKKSTTTVRRRTVKPELDEDAVAEPASKRRRTSSIAPDEQEDTILQDRVNLTEEDVMAATETAREEEAKWDDLDKEDADDPLMVAEYVVEIFDYLKRLERTTLPNPHYIDTQKELAWKMRGILMDWLIQVHHRFKLLPETLFLAVNIIDRFLSARVVSLVKLQLVGITAMFIAAKYEEIMAPSVSNFLYCSDSSYEEKEILEAEKYILRTIDWNLSYPNPIHFLRRSSKADGYDIHVRTVAKYLIEISCVEWRMLGHVPSQIAAAGIWLARLVLDKEEWTPNLEHYSSYTEEELLPSAQLMLTYILRAVKHESFYKKYAGKKYLKASTYVRDWAWAKFGAAEVAYDDEGEPLTGIETDKHIVTVPGSVILAHVLPSLREDARRRREEEAANLGVVVEEDEY